MSWIGTGRYLERLLHEFRRPTGEAHQKGKPAEDT